METTSQESQYSSVSRAAEDGFHSSIVRGTSVSHNGIPQARLESIKLREFIEVAERYRPQLLWLAMRIVSQAEEAEDIVQQALLKAFKKLSGFRGDSQMRTWLNAIVKNTAREYIRSQRGRTFVSLESSLPYDEGSEEIEIQDCGMNPEEYCERREREEIVAAAIGRMGPANREVIEMCVYEELPYMHVATALNLSLTTVKSRMFRSRRDLRMTLSNCAGVLR